MARRGAFRAACLAAPDRAAPLPRMAGLAARLGLCALVGQRGFFALGGDGVGIVGLTGGCVSRGAGPLQRGMVSLLSGRRPGSRLSPGVSKASVPSPRPEPAWVSPEDPPRSKPGRSIPWPRSLAVGGAFCAGFFAAALSLPSGFAAAADGFPLFFISLTLRLSLEFRPCAPPMPRLMACKTHRPCPMPLVAGAADAAYPARGNPMPCPA